ncbi:MAG: 3' terminal RNA ribose 2'-O-methyltransferase Hen1, partial [Bacteroidota bacterium]
MLISINTTHTPATDLGYLLHKHPDRFQSVELSFGRAHVYYPEASAKCCTAVLQLEVDAVALSRKRNTNYAQSFKLGHYVNDRPYATSSFMSTAISKVFGTALGGICKNRPELVQQALPLTITIPGLSAKGGERLIRLFFEPLGYEVELKKTLLDEQFPEFGDSPYYHLTLSQKIPLQKVLQHLYVLLPVLDNNKHYFVSEDEVNKLTSKGQDWLPQHPAYELITRRYLKYKKAYAKKAMALLSPNDDAVLRSATEEQEEKIEAKLSLHQQRLVAVREVLLQAGARRVLDLGCGSAKLIKLLIGQSQFKKILGMDVSWQALKVAHRRLHSDTWSSKMKERVQLIHGSLSYSDPRLLGYEALALVEVIEHLDESRLGALEHLMFEFTKCRTIVITTPNREYNQLFDNLPKGQFRHSDHRFEWTRSECMAWATRVAQQYAYEFEIKPIGPEHEEWGAPSQMVIFNK